VLQNHISILPLKKGAKLAVLGPRSVAREALMGNYYGQICLGEYRELGCVQTPSEAMQTTAAAIECDAAINDEGHDDVDEDMGDP
jgi:xylan 1,4-beta-xylosidase